MDSSIYLGSNSSYSASRDDGVFLEGSPEDSDASSTASSHEEDKKDNKKEEADKPPVEMVFDLQVVCIQSRYILQPCRGPVVKYLCSFGWIPLNYKLIT